MREQGYPVKAQSTYPQKLRGKMLKPVLPGARGMKSLMQDLVAIYG
jgi:hypothetical protein